MPVVTSWLFVVYCEPMHSTGREGTTYVAVCCRHAMAMFLQSQRKWENPELKAENREAFMHACDHHKYDAKSHIVPHGSYLVNLAAKSEEMGQKS